MSKNLCCYVLEKDIAIEEKASLTNEMCNGCRFLMVCQGDLSVSESGRKKRGSKSTKKKLVVDSVSEQVTFDSLFDEAVEVVVDESVNVSEELNVMGDRMDTLDTSDVDELFNLNDVDVGFDDIDDFSIAKVSNKVNVSSMYDVEMPKLDKLVVDETDWLASDAKIDSVSYYGIDLSDEAPYFTESELVSLGRFANSVWSN